MASGAATRDRRNSNFLAIRSTIIISIQLLFAPYVPLLRLAPSNRVAGTRLSMHGVPTTASGSIASHYGKGREGSTRCRVEEPQSLYVVIHHCVSLHLRYSTCSATIPLTRALRDRFRPITLLALLAPTETPAVDPL